MQEHSKFKNRFDYRNNLKEKFNLFKAVCKYQKFFVFPVRLEF